MVDILTLCVGVGTRGELQDLFLTLFESVDLGSDGDFEILKEGLGKRWEREGEMSDEIYFIKKHCGVPLPRRGAK